jgi:hypothetical protein
MSFYEDEIVPWLVDVGCGLGALTPAVLSIDHKFGS